MDGLRHYHCFPMIQDGKRCIETARLFSFEQEIKQNVLYISGNENNETLKYPVICVNGYDILQLNTTDPIQVLNDVMDLIENYNSWEIKIREMILAGVTLQNILEESVSLFDGILGLADLSFYVYAEARGGRPTVGFKLSDQTLTLGAIQGISSQKKVWENTRRAYPLELPSYHAQGAVRNLFLNGRHVGWLISICQDRIPGQADLDRLEILAGMIENYLEIHEHENNKTDNISVFRDILTGEQDKQDALYRLNNIGWKETGSFQVLLLGRQNEMSLSAAVIERKLRILYDNIILIPEGTQWIIINDSGNRNSIQLASFEAFLTKFGWCCGVSASVDNVFDLASALKMAKVAITYTSDKNCVCYFESVAVSYALELVRKHSEIPLLHPVLNQLKEYDDVNATELYNTLGTYLLSERNLVITAKKMHIHRNTVFYRIKRIEELTNVDLEDFYTRLYLLMSYLLG